MCNCKEIHGKIYVISCALLDLEANVAGIRTLLFKDVYFSAILYYPVKFLLLISNDELFLRLFVDKDR